MLRKNMAKAAKVKSLFHPTIKIRGLSQADNSKSLLTVQLEAVTELRDAA